ncbi:gamma-glutamyl-gamma-aminobutyrate hydrolase family protein [Aerococcaceae bacterium DSM 111176]|nr:gamma-glutamyl-gamma-aminobutyrate hydrolase family protein [Aerococcaceae bacterium DSM 111176]
MALSRPADVDNFLINYSPRHYTLAVERAGGIPVLLPLTETNQAEAYIKMVDGLLLTGGQDISPHLYGEEPRAVIGEVSPQRDSAEIALIEAAIKHNKPILGVCRGMQLLNVHFGGTLYQDLSENPDVTVQHVQKSLPTISTHSIETKENSRLYKAFGKNTLINSFHHQAIRDLGKNLTVTAYSKDKLIEGFESEEHNIVAVQWHPEITFDSNQDSLNLFNDLIKRASAKAE